MEKIKGYLRCLIFQRYCKEKEKGSAYFIIIVCSSKQCYKCRSTNGYKLVVVVVEVAVVIAAAAAAASDVGLVLETKSLVSRHIEDKK